jgi:hypothetical protein
MQAFYPLKIQAIRSKGQQARLYVYFPLPLAAAIGLQAGEEVHAWHAWRVVAVCVGSLGLSDRGCS